MTGCGADLCYAHGSAWARGPQLVYDRLAARAVELLREDLAGAVVLDAGAGTGAMTRAMTGRGALVVAADRSPSMLAELRRQHPEVPVVVADATRLPMPSRSVDAAVAGFLINHLPEPASTLAELRRVTRDGGVVLATTFGADDHPVKEAVNAVLLAHGWDPPTWYLDVKVHNGSVANAELCSHAARAAGLSAVRVDELTVQLGDLSTADVVAYRLGMAQSAAFVAGRTAEQRAALVRDAGAVIDDLPGLTLPVVVLQGRR